MLLLASQSPRRRELLALLGMPFEVTSPNVVEDALPNEPPAALVARLSQAKAHAACAEPDSHTSHPGPLIVACDTVVALDGEILGKPRDPTEAEAMLRRLCGRSHTVYSAVTVLEHTTGRTTTEIAETRLTMRPYTDAEIASYVASGDPLDKAGAYAIQHPGFHPVATYQGCYANVMGLPLCHLIRSLRAFTRSRHASRTGAGMEAAKDLPTACQSHTGRHCAVYAAILQSPMNDK